MADRRIKATAILPSVLTETLCPGRCLSFLFSKLTLSLPTPGGGGLGHIPRVTFLAVRSLQEV